MTERSKPEELLSKAVYELEHLNRGYHDPDKTISNLVVVNSKSEFREERSNLKTGTSWLEDRLSDATLLFSKGSTVIHQDGEELHPLVYAKEADDQTLAHELTHVAQEIMGLGRQREESDRQLKIGVLATIVSAAAMTAIIAEKQNADLTSQLSLWSAFFISVEISALSQLKYRNCRAEVQAKEVAEKITSSD